MKKKICLMVLLAVVVMMGGVCEEVNLGPDKEFGIFNSWEYYTGKKGTASYKLDWDAFYARMDKISKNKEYRYIYVATDVGEPESNARLFFCIASYSEDMPVKAAVFGYEKKSGQVLMMFFSSNYDSSMSEFEYTSYSDAIDAWNDYLEYM